MVAQNLFFFFFFWEISKINFFVHSVLIYEENEFYQLNFKYTACQNVNAFS